MFRFICFPFFDQFSLSLYHSPKILIVLKLCNKSSLFNHFTYFFSKYTGQMQPVIYTIHFLVIKNLQQYHYSKEMWNTLSDVFINPSFIVTPFPLIHWFSSFSSSLRQTLSIWKYTT